MKKFLTVLSLAAFLLVSTPVMAAPHHPGGPGGPGGPRYHHSGPRGPHGGHYGGHYGAPPPPPVHHYRRAYSSVGWGVARHGYWAYPGYCNYRLGWYDDFYDPYCRPVRYTPGFYIRF